MFGRQQLQCHSSFLIFLHTCGPSNTQETILISWQTFPNSFSLHSLRWINREVKCSYFSQRMYRRGRLWVIRTWAATLQLHTTHIYICSSLRENKTKLKVQLRSEKQNEWGFLDNSLTFENTLVPTCSLFILPVMKLLFNVQTHLSLGNWRTGLGRKALQPCIRTVDLSHKDLLSFHFAR